MKEMKPWLTLIGVGEEGASDLGLKAQEALAQAEIIFGAERLLNLIPNAHAPRKNWPQPFARLIEEIMPWRGRNTVILATGDPLNYGVGRKLLETFPITEMTILPHLSAFSLAAARLGWSLPDCDLVTLHGRPAAQLEPAIQPDVRLLLLTAGAETIPQVCRRLIARGFGQSMITVLEHMGGPQERITHFRADHLPEQPFSDFNTMAIHCRAGTDAIIRSTSPGLSDDHFHHDGQLTKREIRAITLAALNPSPEKCLWDIGAGCGSIAIEWLRAQRGTSAIAFEEDPKRCALIAENAQSLGVPHLKIIPGPFPASLSAQTLAPPDAIFIGGGLSAPDLFAQAFAALKPGGQLVANAVTLEGEMMLYDLHQRHGGDLLRLDIASLKPIGSYHALKPHLPVTQYRLQKPWGRDTLSLEQNS